MKRKLIGSSAVLLSVMLMAGCGNKIPELSDEQQELVVEYATGMLLKYDANHVSKLVDLTLVQEAEEEAAAQEETSQPSTDKEAEETAKENDNSLEGDMSDVTIIDQTQTIATVEDFLKLDSVKMTYTGYETNDFYPDQAEELHFMMNASEGNKLLVLKFLTENISGADASLDIAQSETRFKIVVNGQEKNALTTMLLNDMAYYQGTIAAGESEELVLICEVPDEETGAISSLELVLKNAEDTVTIPLN